MGESVIITETLFYVCLDTLATSAEIFMIYLCTAAFCRRCEKKALEVLPYIVMVILTENYQRTGNPFLDTIISDKSKKANEQGIDFSAVIQFESESFLAPLDISTIFGNAVDNALEASMTLPQDQRLITIKAGRIHDMLVIVFKNHVLPEKKICSCMDLV